MRIFLERNLKGWLNDKMMPLVTADRHNGDHDLVAVPAARHGGGTQMAGVDVVERIRAGAQTVWVQMTTERCVGDPWRGRVGEGEPAI